MCNEPPPEVCIMVFIEFFNFAIINTRIPKVILLFKQKCCAIDCRTLIMYIAIDYFDILQYFFFQMCVEGCQCKPGFELNSQGDCVCSSDCQKCLKNQEWVTCKSPCPATCNESSSICYFPVFIEFFGFAKYANFESYTSFQTKMLCNLL